MNGRATRRRRDGSPGNLVDNHSVNLSGIPLQEQSASPLSATTSSSSSSLIVQPAPTVGRKRPKLAWVLCNQRRCFKGLIMAGFCLSLIVVASQLYQKAHTSDPCVVASQRGFASQHESQHNLQQQPLPKIIHQQWATAKDIPEKFQHWQSQWKTLFPDHHYMLWTDKAGRELIATHYEWFLPIYDNCYRQTIKRVDATRYFVLYHYGGLYADLDYEPLTNQFWERLPTQQVSVVESPYQYSEGHQNSFMSSPRGDRFWNETVFPMLVERCAKTVLTATGPSFLDAAIASHREKAQQQHPRPLRDTTSSTAVTTLPCENYHRIPFSGHTSPLVTRLWNHWFLGNIYPMKYCGNFDQTDNCHYARHHNAVTYLSKVWGKDGLLRTIRESFK